MNTTSKKEVTLYESFTSLESIEEYVEVTGPSKIFLSSSDQDSFKFEDFENVHATGNNVKKHLKYEKRKI